MKLNLYQALKVSEIQGLRINEDDKTFVVNPTNRQHARYVAGFIMLASLGIVFVCFALRVGLEAGSPTVATDTNTRRRDGRDTNDTVIVCYYNTPDRGANASEQLLPARVPPALCTHVNVAFARVVDKQIYLEPAQRDDLRGVVELKRINPRLKVLLSVGGSGADAGFSEMVVDHASRKIFIRSIKSMLRNYTLDGIDLDWEFPGFHAERAGAARERQHFSQLLREIRAEYAREHRPYLLSVALAAPEPVVDVAYDVDQIDLYADFANLMTYDFHYFGKFTPFTGLNAPLYARAGEDLYPATLNLDYTARLYAARGLRPAKTVLGVPTYAHSFRLVSARNAGVGAPAAGPGALGGGGGFADYPAVCAFLRAGAARRWEPAARVPYASAGREWLSYESPRSAAEKARYVRAAGLRGAMLYSLNADDHAGRCGAPGAGAGAAFPLARAVRDALAAPAPPPAGGP